MRNTIRQSPKRIMNKPGLLRSRHASHSGRKKAGRNHAISTSSRIGRGTNKSHRGTMSRSNHRTVRNSAKTRTGLSSTLSTRKRLTAHNARRSFNILNNAAGRNIAQATGSQITAPGGSAADMAGISSPTNIFVDILGGIMDSESAFFRSWSWEDTHASNTAAIGSALSTHGRNTGETTGITPTTCMSTMWITGTTCSIAGIRAPASQSAYPCRR